jgi:hypothetical protein
MHRSLLLVVSKLVLLIYHNTHHNCPNGNKNKLSNRSNKRKKEHPAWGLQGASRPQPSQHPQLAFLASALPFVFSRPHKFITDDECLLEQAGLIVDGFEGFEQRWEWT